MRSCSALRHRLAERGPGGSSRPHRTLEYRAGRRTDHQTRSLLKRIVSQRLPFPEKEARSRLVQTTKVLHPLTEVKPAYTE